MDPVESDIQRALRRERVATPRRRGPQPWLGARSYGPADGDLFHGRDAEGAELAGFLATRSLSVLAAPSGMGKTSLLHARVIPWLERERWLVVYARPEDDPREALRKSLVDHLLPDPRDEAEVIDQLACAITDDAARTLAAGVTWYQTREPKERIGHQLFRPAEQGELDPLPMICRALRGSLGVGDLIEHYEAVVADGPALGLRPDTPLVEAANLLRGDATRRLREQWIDELRAPGSLPGAIRQLREQWFPLRPGLAAILLLVDQCEEVFTRLRSGAMAALLEDARECMTPSERAGPLPPCHFTLSLRKEFIADLVPHLRPFGDIEQLTYFLGPLRESQAREALTRPARLVGVEFATGDADGLARLLAIAAEDDPAQAAGADVPQYERALPDAVPIPGPSRAAPGGSDLPGSKPERAFRPVVISILGAHLWSRLKHDTGSGSVRSPLTAADVEALVGSLESVFAAFLDDALRAFDGAGPADADRFDALELLDRLGTSAGYREVRPQDDLVAELPLREPAALALIDRLDQELRLVRRQLRRGTGGAKKEFVIEIMHERLIQPVRDMLVRLQASDVGRAALPHAYRLLHSLPDDPDVTRDPLPEQFRAVLARYLERLDLDALAVKTLLRSMLVGGPTVEDGRDRGPAGRADPAAWSDVVGRLCLIPRGTRPAKPGRMPLLTGDLLASAVGEYLERPGLLDTARRLHLLSSALADTGAMQDALIHRLFSGVAQTGERP